MFRRSDEPHVAERRWSITAHTAVGSAGKPEEGPYLLDQRIGAGFPRNSRRRPLRPAHTVVGVVNLVRGVANISFGVPAEDPDLVWGGERVDEGRGREQEPTCPTGIVRLQCPGGAVG